MRGKVLFCFIFNAMNSTKKFFPNNKASHGKIWRGDNIKTKTTSILSQKSLPISISTYGFFVMNVSMKVLFCFIFNAMNSIKKFFP